MNSRGPLDWTPEEFGKLLFAAANLMPTKWGDFARGMYTFLRLRGGHRHTCQRRDWWIAYLYVARETGLSWSQLKRLQTTDVSSKGVLTIRLSQPKELRSFQLSDAAREALAALPSGRGYLLAVAVLDVALSKRWRTLNKAAGLFSPEAKNDYPPLRFSQSKPNVTLIRGEVVNPDGITTQSKLVDFFESVYFRLRLSSRSPRTVELYRRTLSMFSQSLERPARLSDLADDAVEAHLGSLMARNLSPYTVEKERQQLCAIWRFACQRRLVDLYPTVLPRKLPERAPLGWTIDDLNKLFAAARKVRGMLGKAPAAVWWVALLYVLYDTAERINAVMQLTWDHVDLEAGWLTVPAEFRKGKTRDVVSRIHPQTIEALKELQSHGKVTDRIFPWRRADTTLWDHLSKILQSAGLPSDCRSKFHRIRRTTASYYERGGGDATALLDHSSRKVTKKYLDARIIERKHAIDVLPRPKVDDKKGGAS